MLWITNGYLKIFERIFTNGIFNSGDYLSFVATTFAASLLEIVNHVTHFHRVSVVDKLLGAIRNLKSSKNRAIRSVSVIPSDEIQRETLQVNQKLSHEETWAWSIRKKLILEEISIELMMIFTVTFLLYFVHPLIQNDKVETIGAFEFCAVNSVIQIVFELISDCFGVYWAISRHNIPLRFTDVEIVNKWFWVWLFFMLCQSLWIFWFLFSF
eukprot:TRINITY_DN19180_c0_g1_i1.p1 TRINITY_DN19180_c0_g1~~TRINITY_DN19180_c0_g1_i1.p1  ORF type:complete len:212 (-),score=37.45 TRINITY_DN19180_c0_g1_i1:517-1152(-)